MTSVDLTGRTVLVTGAGSGIGASTARALTGAGAHVVAHYRGNRDGAVAATGGPGSGRAMLLQADLSRPGAAARVWQRAVAWRGRVDALVCNAAVMPLVSLDATDDEWETSWSTALRVNVIEPAGLIRRAVSHHREHGGGVVVTVSSWAAQRGSSHPDLATYAATKAALAAFTKSVAASQAAHGVLAYLVAPGVVDTGMSVAAAQAGSGVDAVTAGLAMREWVPPAEVAEVITWLAGGHVRHLSGATLDLNGATYIR